MKTYITLTAFIFLYVTVSAQQLKPVAQKVNERTAYYSFESIQLFNPADVTTVENIRSSSGVKHATVFEIRGKEQQNILNNKPQNILLTLPGNGNNSIELLLFRAQIFTPDFTITTASGKNIIPEGVHYHGIIKGDNSSLAAVSIFDNEVMGLISSPSSGNMILGKLNNDEKGRHVLYKESELPVPSSECFTADDNEIYSLNQLQSAKISLVNCIRLYWEVNYDIFLDKGSVSNAANYVTGLFNESAAIYANDNIPVELSQVFVWDTPSPYTSTTTPGVLGQFQAYRNSFTGDLGHLLGYAGGGGIAAGFNGLCAANLDNSQCYSGISSTYNNFPTYSWSVEVVTHEQGHLMGSRHTHACVWNGNNTAIDGCGPAAGYPYEGSCSGALIPPAGGTIMSYCHLVSAGINFSNGFGTQPATVIVNNYNNASCLSPCGSGLCLAPSNLSTTNITTAAATFNWDTVPGAVSYNIQYRITGTSTWLTGNTPVNSYLANGLTPGSTYEWQVQTVCSGGSSIFTLSTNFITIPLTCDVPLNTSTLNITAVSALLKWDAVAGALNYDVRYRVTGSGIWTNANTTNTSYAATGLTPVTNYEWQVQTNCAGGDSSAFSSSENFTTLAVGQQVTIVLQPDGVCGKDAVIADCIACGYYNTNFGNSAEFNAIAWTNGGNISDSRALLQFDLTGIPAGSVIQSAYLSLFYDSISSNLGHSQLSGSNECNIYKNTDPWDEDVVTWTNKPGTTSVNSGYLPASSSNTQDYTNIDITAMVQDFTDDPQHNYGMMVQLINETAYRSLIFCSSDHVDPTTHPKLEITYLPAVDSCIHYQYAACYGIDAMVSSCVPCGYDTMNSGKSPEIDAIAWTNQGNISNARSLLYWNLSAIPTNAIISGADISLFTWNSPSNGQHSPLTGPNDAYLNRVTSAWDEYTVDWNSMPSVSTVNQAYLPASTSVTQDYLDIDVTAMVQDMVANPASNFGFMLQLVDETFYRKLIFASSDHADPAKHPLLEICYTVPTNIPNTIGESDISVIEDFATQLVTVKSSKDFDESTALNIYNTTGQLVRKFEHLKGRVFVFSKSGLHGGVYLYQLTSGNKIINGKLLFR